MVAVIEDTSSSATSGVCSRWVRGLVVLFACACLDVHAVAHAAPAQQASVSSPLDRALSEATPEDLAEGQRTYTAQCALCHGIDGSGGAGPSLQRPTLTRAADDAGLIGVLLNGVPGAMPDGRANTPRRLWQTAAFVRSLGRAASESVTGNVTKGAAIYRQRGCGTCHVTAGEGRAFGPDLTAIGAQRGAAHLRQSIVAPAEAVPEGHVVVTATPKGSAAVRGVRVSEDVFWVHVRDASGRLHTFRKADLADLQREVGASLMPSYASVLTPSDLDDLVAYLASLKGQR